MAEQFGPYRVGELLGRGSMGVVHRAHDTANDRTVALKRLLTADADYEARFRRESRLAAALTHPHVVPVHAYGEIDGTLYLDMMLVGGVDLHRLLADGLTPDDLLVLLGQVADAIDAAHAVGLVHRDVKPSNVMVDRAGHAYLADFGIARPVSAAATAITRTGHFIGSLDYIAPERLGGEADGRADVHTGRSGDPTAASPALPRHSREWYVALALCEPWLTGADDYPRPPSNREIHDRVLAWHGYAWNLVRPQRVDDALRLIAAVAFGPDTNPFTTQDAARKQHTRFAVARRAAEVRLVTPADLAEVERARRSRR